jgi:hypothetical protein
LTVIGIGINLHPGMIPEISGHSREIARLCEKYRVLRLVVFGSAARGDFEAASSDIDLIAAFASTREPGYADRYMEFADSLEALFGRRVDLLTPPSIRNPHFIKSIERDAVIIYEARKPQAA